MHRPSRLKEYAALEQGSQQWLDARRECDVTASEVGAALGISRYKSRAALINEKLGPPQVRHANVFMQAGHHYEEVIAHAYCQAFPGCVMTTYGMNVAAFDDDDLRVGASPDRLVEFPDGTWALMEIKYTSSDDFSLPFDHLAQMLTQAYCFDAPAVEYVKWGPGSVDAQGNMVLRMCRVTFDPALWNDFVYPALLDFKMCLQRKIACNPNSSFVKQVKGAFLRHAHISAVEM